MSTLNLDPTVLLKPAEMTLGNMPRSGSSDDGFREHLERARNETAPSSPAADDSAKRAPADEVQSRDEDKDSPSEADAAQQLAPTATPPAPQAQEEKTKDPSEETAVKEAAQSEPAANEAPSQGKPGATEEAAKIEIATQSTAAEAAKPVEKNSAGASDDKVELAKTKEDVVVEKGKAAIVQPDAAGKPASTEQQPQVAAAEGEIPSDKMQTVMVDEVLPPTPPDGPAVDSAEAANKATKSKKGQTQADAATAQADAAATQAAATQIDGTVLPATADTPADSGPGQPLVTPAVPRKAASNRRPADAASPQSQTAAALNAANAQAVATVPEENASLAKSAESVAVESPSAAAAPSPVEAAAVKTSTRQVESAAGGKKSQRGAELESRAQQADRQRFVQRVAKAFEAMGDRNGSLRLRLSPPELGSLRMEITVRNGHLTAQVEAETNTARNMLLDNLPALRERLMRQDIKIDRFEVRLTEQQREGGVPQQTLQQQTQGDGQHDAQSRSSSGRGGKTAGPASKSSAAPEAQAAVIENNRLNVVI